MGSSFGQDRSQEEKKSVSAEAAIEITIPRVPMNVSALNKHWRVRHKQKGVWMDEIVCCDYPTWGRRFAKQWATDKRRIHLDVTIRRVRLFDRDNLYGSLKPVLDAMKAAGFLWDDSDKYLELGKVIQFKCSVKDARTILKWWPVEAEK
jgi:hypothetical protein